MNITIDGQLMSISKDYKNIVDAATEHGIGIPAPCYQSSRKSGCCKACIIEIDGNKAYACSTKPKDGMEIVLNRSDLLQLRRERIQDYKDAPAQNCDCDCDCDADTSTVSCC